MTSRVQLIEHARAAMQLGGDHSARMTAVIGHLDQLRAYARTEKERETLHATRQAAEALVGEDLEAVEQEKLRALARAWLRFDLEWERPGST